MLNVNEDGIVNDQFIKIRRKSVDSISTSKNLKGINAIIVHQTMSDSAESTMSGYEKPKKDPAGAHFLIDLDGTIYQTAKLTKQCYHVGPIRSRCFMEMTCDPSEIILHGKVEQYGKQIGQWGDGQRVKASSHKEESKPYPERYAGNWDSLGIEVVGNIRFTKKEQQDIYDKLPDNKKEDYKNRTAVFDTINASQMSALAWLLNELKETFASIKEVVTHYTASRKAGDPKVGGDEARSAEPAIESSKTGWQR